MDVRYTSCFSQAITRTRTQTKKQNTREKKANEKKRDLFSTAQEKNSHRQMSSSTKAIIVIDHSQEVLVEYVLAVWVSGHLHYSSLSPKEMIFIAFQRLFDLSMTVFSCVVEKGPRFFSFFSRWLIVWFYTYLFVCSKKN
ncbi:MAG: hypothetical protein GY714_18430 [Desulfobacterales bacterium]|nr:hypothetical protein [Desulfobacterales bacterium]